MSGGCRGAKRGGPDKTKTQAKKAHNALRIAMSLILVGATMTACSDGTPAFCGDLSKAQQLDGVVSALKENNLKKASSEAKNLQDLASKAPSDIRSDLAALADGVVDIIDLVRRDQEANSVSDHEKSDATGSDTQPSHPQGTSGTNTGQDSDSVDTSKSGSDTAANGSAQNGNDDTQDDVTVTNPPSTEPTDVEQRRNELNSRLGELDKRSEKVGNWALEQCGIKL